MTGNSRDNTRNEFLDSLDMISRIKYKPEYWERGIAMALITINNRGTALAVKNLLIV